MKLDSAVVHGHHHLSHVVGRETVALFGSGHVPASGERHLTILQVKPSVRKLIEATDVVVVQMGENHLWRASRIDADKCETLGRASHERTFAAIGVVLSEARVDDPGFPVAHNRPDEVVHRHRDVVWVTADEMLGTARLAFRILDRKDVVRRRVGHGRRVPNMDNDLFETGLQARSRVIGPEYVSKAFSAADTFSREFQEMVTEYCWGGVWGREALTDRQRSLNNLCILASLNRGHEFKLHFKGALKNGCTLDELRDTLIQIMVYAGVPAGVESFRLAREVLDAEGITPPPTDRPMPNIPAA
jgi:4-carboxymuconolactone decarboxylase